MSGPFFAILPLLPWTVSALLLIGLYLAGRYVGVPAAKIAMLERHIQAMDYRLKEAKERADMAEQRANDLQEQLADAVKRLEAAAATIHTLVDAFEIKCTLTALADARQPVIQ